jgi:hypothetical protein
MRVILKCTLKKEHGRLWTDGGLIVASYTKFKITTLANLITPCGVVAEFKHDNGQTYATNSKHFIQRKHD